MKGNKYLWQFYKLALLYLYLHFEPKTMQA